MPTSYTNNLKLSLPVQGELAGSWGDLVNQQITQFIEDAVAGAVTINSWTANSHTLTFVDAVTSEARFSVLELTDTGVLLTGPGEVIVPDIEKLYVIDNRTGRDITVKTAIGPGTLVPVEALTYVRVDGTDVFPITSTGIGGLTVETVSVNTTAESGVHYHVDTAGLTITLPLTPDIGDQVAVSVDNFTNVVVARNGSNIAGAAANFNMDVAESYILFRYVDATEGWTIAGSVVPNGTNVVPAGAENQTLRYNATGLEATGDMIIDATGNVGIGTTPSYPLDVLGRVRVGAQAGSDFGAQLNVSNTTATNSWISVQQQGVSTLCMGSLASDTNVYIRNCYTTGELTGGSGIAIDSSGNVGIGTNDPSSLLEVSASNAENVPKFQISQGLDGIYSTTVIANNMRWDGAAWVKQAINIGGAAIQLTSPNSFGAYGQIVFNAIDDDNTASGTVVERMRIDSDGNVQGGIWSDNGTANASAKFVKCTQAEYDLLTPDANTIYFIT